VVKSEVTSISAGNSSAAATRITHAWRKTLRRYKHGSVVTSGQEKRDRMAAVGRAAFPHRLGQ